MARPLKGFSHIQRARPMEANLNGMTWDSASRAADLTLGEGATRAGIAATSSILPTLCVLSRCISWLGFAGVAPRVSVCSGQIRAAPRVLKSSSPAPPVRAVQESSLGEPAEAPLCSVTDMEFVTCRSANAGAAALRIRRRERG